MIIKNRFWSWNKKKMGWTLPLRKSQRNEKINLAIGKPRVFNPCSQETPSFQTLWSGIIRKHQVFQPFFCHPLRTLPGKSYFSHLSYHIFHLGWSPLYNETTLHIFSIWVGHPLQWDRSFSHFFHLGRSPLQWDRISHSFHMGRSPIIIRLFFPFFHLGRSPITMRPFFTFFPCG